MPTDLDKLQGTWLISSLVADGRTMSSGEYGGASIAIAGDMFVSNGMGAVYEGIVRLDGSKTPKWFDLEFTVGHAAGTKHPGIYRIAGKTWTLCLASRGTTRHKTFASKPGSGIVLETFTRAPTTKASKPGGVGKSGSRARGAASADAQQDEASSGPATIIEGDWEMVEGVLNGAVMADNMVQWCRRVTRGDVTSVVAGPQVILKARFSLDPSTTPHGIDYVNLAGSNKGKAQKGILQLEGTTLKVCMAAPGKPRPTEFSSAKGDGRSYTAWRRP